jgi:hypothetical protein
MGLDMYLTKKTYVKNWSHMKPEELHHITIKGPEAINIKPERIKYIIEEIGCWSKANAIHAWFVANVQDGEDDCKENYVSMENIKDLLDTCEKVLKASKLIEGQIMESYTFDKNGEKITKMIAGKVIENTAIAEEFLPTSAGFFFGGTDYEECYVEHLKNTIKILKKAIASPGNYYYCSSW